MKVIILSGVSGSGKSTYAKKHWPNTPTCSADHFFMVDGEYRFDPARLASAHGACLRDFVDRLLASSEECLVVDNTNTTIAEIAPYVALAQAYGHAVRIVTVLCVPEVAAKRNTHGVSESIVLAQATRLNSRDMPPWWAHEYIGDDIASNGRLP